MRTAVKIYGIERSGTNFLQALINWNTDAHALSNCYGWKHGKVTIDVTGCDQDFGYEYLNLLIIVKNPYTWYDSIKRYTKDFTKIYTLDEAYNKYNELYRHYLSVKVGDFYRKKYIVKYEDLLTDTRRTLCKIGKRFGFNMLFNEIVMPKVVNMSPHFSDDRRKRYIGRPSVSCDEIHKVNDRIDIKLIKKLGYALEGCCACGCHTFDDRHDTINDNLSNN